ncbi:glycosyltransferase, group 1 family protein [Leptospira inadai serovar Lyme str. 10]|uniref:Glycosyltransferase, group 1 family protein n=1 Tax=Leptospira inadai serovar Lyme str. 10 TaxID=1049790 RepID=V6HCI4_9LEPT|nr:glycosyltransferase family 4 protein [Leptospira inadai]EQA36588.1 glycosyltransferase, group 1 family protein [Leptospira inadai serovar Lyme str. 10]
MRIAVWWHQESWGGVDTHLLTLLSNWPGAAKDEFVIIHNEDNEGLNRIRKSLESFKNISFIVRKRNKRLFGFLGRLFSYFVLPFFFIFEILNGIRILKKAGTFDAILCVNGNYPGAWNSLAALSSAKRLGISKRMLLVHHESQARRVFLNTFEHLIDMTVQRSATDLVCVSLATRRTLIERRGFDTVLNPIRVIHNGIDFVDSHTRSVVDLREKFKISSKELLIGMLGRIERYKGHEDLLIALSEIQDGERKKIRLLFVGGGEEGELNRLKRLGEHLGVEERVEFAEYIPGAPGAIIRQFDLLAMLTKDFEGFGYTIAEAMQVGTPVLATKVGAVEEFASPPIASLVPPESPSSIATVLSEFVRNRKEFRDRAALAKTHIQSFNGKTMAERFYLLLTT